MTIISTGKGSSFDKMVLDPSLKTAGVPVSELSKETVYGSEVPGAAVPPELIDPNFSHKKYVGYRIEKQKYDTKTQTWLHVGNIFVDDLSQDIFYDTRISYNTYYRYRAYSILRIVKDGTIKHSQEYSDLIHRIVELAPEASDILKIYGTIYNAYWLESYPSGWKYIRIVDKRPPKPPEDFQVHVKSSKKQIWCSWIPYANTQKDIVGYRVFRKGFGELYWKLVFEGAKSDNLFVDEGISMNSKYVYAVQTYDVHGLYSKLSAQWLVQADSFYDDEYDTYNISLYQNKGEVVDSDEYGNYETKNIILSNAHFSNDILSMGKFKIVPNIHFPSYDRDFIIKVTSLDIDETHEIVFKLRKIDVPNEENIGESLDRPVVSAKPLDY